MRRPRSRSSRWMTNRCRSWATSPSTCRPRSWSRAGRRSRSPGRARAPAGRQGGRRLSQAVDPGGRIPAWRAHGRRHSGPIDRSRLGERDRARPRLAARLGQDRDRDPARSGAGAGQARRHLEPVGPARRGRRRHPAERYSVTRAHPDAAASAAQSWATNQALRFNVLPTDTSFSLGAATSSTDDKWLRTLSAEQKLFGGPLSVTGSVSETASGDTSKSLRAGFRQTW